MKNILPQHGLATTGRKVEFILRMQQSDPTGVWIEEAFRQADIIEDEEDVQEDDTIAQEQEVAQSLPGNNLCQREAVLTNDLRQREVTLTIKERALIQKEIDLL